MTGGRLCWTYTVDQKVVAHRQILPPDAFFGPLGVIFHNINLNPHCGGGKGQLTNVERMTELEEQHFVNLNT